MTHAPDALRYFAAGRPRPPKPEELRPLREDFHFKGEKKHDRVRAI